MKLEIERKFLVRGQPWQDQGEFVDIEQGYLCLEPSVVRVRAQAGPGRPSRAFVTIKGEGLLAREEYEYEIPTEDAGRLLHGGMCQHLVIKRRYLMRHARHLWEVDVFRAANAGLVMAEIELAHAGEPFDRPCWLGEEVTHDARYANANLSRVPWGTW